ncbi:MAG: ZIP family metal transporter [Anaerolineales bacterium]
MNAIWMAALLSLIAGMGTGLGGIIAIIRRPGRRAFGFLMGITAGVMISLSFLQLVSEAWKLQGYLTATIGFGAGAILMFGLDILLPHIHFGEREGAAANVLEGDKAAGDPDCESDPEASLPIRGQALNRGKDREGRHPHSGDGRDVPRRRNPVLLQSGILLAIGITIHNLPEGIAVGAGYVHLPEFGFFIALAIMLHNIPEGIATALPLCQGGMRRRDAFLVALLSGFAEPVGALAAASFLGNFKFLIPGSLAFAGGVMMFITLDELIPIAREHGHQHYVAMGLISGSIAVFLLSGLMGV